MKSDLAFDQKMFVHINESRIAEGKKPSSLFKFIRRIIGKPIIFIPLGVFERVMGTLLALPIPVYRSLIYSWVSNSRGLPKFFGMYLRALYYRRVLKIMEPNVFIDEGVIFANPKGVILREFSYIDKRVMILCNDVIVGRRVHLAPNVLVSGGGSFEIEDYACISFGASVVTATEEILNGARCSGPMVTPSQRDVTRGHVHIEKDAFIGPNAVIFPNVIVKQGSFISAGITVAKNTDPWGMYVGGYGKKISNRDPVAHQDD